MSIDLVRNYASGSNLLRFAESFVNTNRSSNKVQKNEKYPNSNVLDMNEVVINAAVWHALNHL